MRKCDEIERRLRLAALSAERTAVYALAHAHQISDECARKLVRDVGQEERFR